MQKFNLSTQLFPYLVAMLLYPWSSAFAQLKTGEDCKADFAISVIGAEVTIKPMVRYVHYSKPDQYWSFGDSTFLYHKNDSDRFVHSYTHPGRYRIQLYATNSYAVCNDTISKWVHVTTGLKDTCPRAKLQITVDTTGIPGDSAEVTLEGLDKGNLLFKWDFKYNYFPSDTHKIVVGRLPINTYIRYFDLTVTDTIHNCTTKTTAVIHPVNDVNHCRVPKFDPVFTDYPPGVTQFMVFGYSSLAYAHQNFKWDFGDGTESVDTINAKHYYAKDTTYNVCFMLTDSLEGCSDTVCRSIDVRSCNAHFTYSPFGPTTNMSVNFVNQSSGKNMRFLWEFGDGDTSKLENPDHQFAVGDTNYTVTLYMQDSVRNCSDSFINQIFVYPTCHAQFDATTSDLDVTFKTRAKGNSYIWYFNDGSVDTTTKRTVTHSYTAYRNYNVSLVVINDAWQCSDSVSKIITLKDTLCSVDFGYQKVGNSNNMKFSSYGSGHQLSYSWSFGDGKMSNSTHPVHHFSHAGNYQVKLSVLDTTGCKDSISYYVTIDSMLCKAFFKLAVDTSVGRTLFAIEKSNGNNLHYKWYFGDGDSSDTRCPTHSYSHGGLFHLCLRVHNDSCSDFYCDTFSIDSSGNFSFKKGFSLVILPDGTVGIKKTEIDLPRIYPMPFQNEFYVEKLLKSSQLKIVNLSGQEWPVSISMIGEKTLVRTSVLPPGIYFLTIIDGKNVYTSKIIKE